MSRMRIVVTAIVASSWALTALGVTDGVLFRGRLVDRLGHQLRSPSPGRYRLYRGGAAEGIPSTGILVYEEAALLDPSADGLFTHLLGSGTPVPPFTSTDRRAAKLGDSDGPLWLEIVADPDGVAGTLDDEPFVPRIAVASEGYAVFTHAAATLEPAPVQAAATTPDVPVGADPEPRPGDPLAEPDRRVRSAAGPNGSPELPTWDPTLGNPQDSDLIRATRVKNPDLLPPVGDSVDQVLSGNLVLGDVHGLMWPTAYARCNDYPSCAATATVSSSMVFGQRSDNLFGQRDNVFLWAYNYNLLDGNRLDFDEAMYKDQIETSFWDGMAKIQYIERNWDYTSADGRSTWRPLAFQIATGGSGATDVLDRADWLFRTCADCKTLRLDAWGDTVSIGGHARQAQNKLLVQQEVGHAWASQDGVKSVFDIGLDDASAAQFEYVGMEGQLTLNAFSADNEIASIVGARGVIEIGGESTGARRVRNTAAGVQGRCWITASDDAPVDSKCVGGLFQASAHGIGSHLNIPVLYAAYLQAPYDLGAGVDVGNGGGLFIEDMRGYGSGGRQGAIYVARQTAALRAGRNGNIRMEGGSWNDGHLQLGNGHLWWDATGAQLRVKTDEPVSEQDGRAVLAGTGSDSHGVLLWGDPSDPAFTTGDEVCAASGLTCVGAKLMDAHGPSSCSTIQAGIFYARCR